MQHDEVIWQVIRHNHCSFMSKIETGIFCRNPYNVTGTCNRSSCPLANSRYATIREHDGVFYLYMKTIERAHTPNKMWERVKLPRNYAKALEIIDKHLAYWPQLLVHKTKQRLTKLTQMRIRMRKLALKTREKIMTVPTKEKKREARREEKALRAALLENNIEKELLVRLKKGIYPYNPLKDFEEEARKLREQLKLLNPEYESEDEEEPETEFVESLYDEVEDDIEDFGDFRTRDDVDDDDNDELDDDEDGNDNVVDDDEEEPTVFVPSKRGRKGSAKRVRKDERPSKSKKKGKAHVEVEREDATERQTAVQ